MLTKVLRSSRVSIRDTMRGGLRVSFQHLSLTHKRARRHSFTANIPSTFAFIVPASVSKKSSDRNLLKKHARHIIHLHKNRIIPNQTIVFYFKKGSVNFPFKNLEKEILAALFKENLYA